MFVGLWWTPPRTAERQAPLGSTQAPSLQRSGLLSLCGPEEVSESQTLKKTDSETPRQERGGAQGMSWGEAGGERGCLQHTRMSVSTVSHCGLPEVPHTKTAGLRAQGHGFWSPEHW